MRAIPGKISLHRLRIHASDSLARETDGFCWLCEVLIINVCHRLKAFHLYAEKPMASVRNFDLTCDIPPHNLGNIVVRCLEPSFSANIAKHSAIVVEAVLRGRTYYA
jgi:hypothetical protein